MARPTRYLILPARGLQASTGLAGPSATQALVDLAQAGGARALERRLERHVRALARPGAPPPAARLRLVASLAEDGVKLVESTPESMAALRYEQPGLRVVPEVFYRPAVARARLRARAARPAAPARAAERRLVVSVVDAATGAPVPGVEIVAFTDYGAGEGVAGVTTRRGRVTLRVRGRSRYQRVYAQHERPGLWSGLERNVPAEGTLTFRLEPLDLSAPGALGAFHAPGADLAVGTGVRVGVIDSGVDAAHPDLKVAGGLGCVPGSPESEFGPSGAHGTHVAGIIAGRGAAPTGVRGVAPGAALFSYRVFDDTEGSGSSFGVVKAIRRGVADGCDLLNMSLGLDHDEATGEPVVDDAIREAIAQAHAAGVVVVAAAGNEGRRPVTYPALDDHAVAVSAVGRKGTFPAGSGEAGDVAAPYGADPDVFLAAFSNVGAALDAAGAGVGVVSTVPGGHAPMSGTSMACPAVTGVLARLLASSPAVRALPRGAGRSDAVRALLFAHARPLGLGLLHEGRGVPR